MRFWLSYLKGRNHKSFLALAALVFCFPAISLSNGEVRPDDTHGYRFQFLTFRAYNSKKTYLEVYAQIPSRNLTYFEGKEGYEADYSVTVNIYDHLGLFVDAKFFKNSIQLASLNELPSVGSQILRFDFSLSSGEHKIIVYVTDLKNLESYAFSQVLNIPDYRTAGPQLSDLQLSLSIKRAKEESAFVKQNWLVFPNVSKVFAQPFKTLFFYAELYNLSAPLSDSKVTLKSVLTIKDMNGKILKSITSPNLKFGTSNILIGQIPIEELAGGVYELILGVTDLDNEQSVEKSTRFAVAGPSSEVTKVDRVIPSYVVQPK